MASIIDPEKRELRGRVRERLAALSPEELVRSDEALFERFLALPQVAAARTIFAFWGIPGKEPDTAWLIGELVRRGKTVGLPRMLPEHRMEVRQYDPDKPLVKVSFGISEPGEDCPPLRREEIGLVLVPAVCYDRRGYRLGFGGAGRRSSRRRYPSRPTTPGWTFCLPMGRACPSEAEEKAGGSAPRPFPCVGFSSRSRCHSRSRCRTRSRRSHRSRSRSYCRCRPSRTG